MKISTIQKDLIVSKATGGIPLARISIEKRANAV
jgi:hypothetical protein